MADYTSSIQPGYYKTPIGPVTVSFDTAAVSSYAYSADPLSPLSISSYIAYDTLSPPNPFIAVTQDGRGNVVYDGGFPKFYNGSWNNATTFAALTAACKYLHNAMHWVANKTKVAAGNRNVLIIDDNIISQNYSVKNETIGNGFKRTLNGVCAVAGFTPHYEDSDDYAPDTYTPTLEHLEQFALVIVFGSRHRSASTISDETVRNFVRYRENGNGIILITDHGVVVNDISQAVQGTAGGFFVNVNRIASQFGAYFSGDFNRTPVNVGFLRNTYGDHALYNGMTNEEFISAGGSESQVFVTRSEIKNASESITVTPQNGTTDINVFYIKKDGNSGNARLTYIIDTQPILKVKSVDYDKNGARLPAVDNTVVVRWDGSLGAQFSVDFGNYPLTGYPALPWQGFLKVNGNVVGVINVSLSQSAFKFFNGLQSMPLSPGDVLVQEFVGTPSYSSNIVVTTPSISPPSNIYNKGFMDFYKSIYPDANITKFEPYVQMLLRSYYSRVPAKMPLTRAQMIKDIRDINARKRPVHYGTHTAAVFPTEAQARSWLNTGGVRQIPAAIAADTGYYFVKLSDGTIAKQPSKYHVVFGAPCHIANDVGSNYNVDATGNYTLA